MTIVELSDGTWITLYVDGREVARVWGFPEVELGGAGDRWLVIVRDLHNLLIAFVYADAIRRE